MLNLSIPEHIQPLRQKVLNFVEQEVYPVEAELTADKVGSRRGDILKGHALIRSGFLGQTQYLLGDYIAHDFVGSAGKAHTRGEQHCFLIIGFFGA